MGIILFGAIKSVSFEAESVYRGLLDSFMAVNQRAITETEKVKKGFVRSDLQAVLL